MRRSAAKLPETAALIDRRGAEPPLALADAALNRRSTGLHAAQREERNARVGIDGRRGTISRRTERERSTEAGGDEDGAGEAQAGTQRPIND